MTTSQDLFFALQSSVMGGAVLNVTDVKKRPIGLFVIAVLHLFFSGVVAIVLLRYNYSVIYHSVEKTHCTEYFAKMPII